MRAVEHIRDYGPKVFRYDPPQELKELRKNVPDRRRVDSGTFDKKKSELIARAQEITGLINPEVRRLLPTYEDYWRLAPASDVIRFFNPFQVRDEGKHNRTHLTTIAVMAGVLAAEMTAGTVDAQRVVTGSVINGYLHDIMRKDDALESVLDLPRHGKSISQRLPEDLYILMSEGLVGRDVAFVRSRMQSALEFHDIPVDAPKDVQSDPMFRALVLADSLAMLRYLTHRSGFRPLQNINEYTIERKLLNYGKGDQKIEALRTKYTEVMAGFLLLSDEYVAEEKKKLEDAAFRRGIRIDALKSWANRDYQITGVLRAAQELGLLGNSSQSSATNETPAES